MDAWCEGHPSDKTRPGSLKAPYYCWFTRNPNHKGHYICEMHATTPAENTNAMAGGTTGTGLTSTDVFWH